MDVDADEIAVQHIEEGLENAVECRWIGQPVERMKFKQDNPEPLQHLAGG